MGKIDDRIKEMKIELPESPQPLANYVSVQRDGDILYFSGASAMKNGKPIFQGKLGRDLSVDQGYEAAKLAAINLIAVLKREVEDLDRVDQILKVFGLVACSDDFYQQPAVINGASDLFVEIFGDKGRHARSAVGTNALPLNLPLEIEMIVRIR